MTQPEAKRLSGTLVLFAKLVRTPEKFQRSIGPLASSEHSQFVHRILG